MQILVDYAKSIAEIVPADYQSFVAGFVVGMTIFFLGQVISAIYGLAEEQAYNFGRIVYIVASTFAAAGAVSIGSAITVSIADYGTLPGAILGSMPVAVVVILYCALWIVSFIKDELMFRFGR